MDFCFSNLGLGLIEPEEISCVQTNDSRVILEFQFSFHPGTEPSQSGRIWIIYFYVNDTMPSLRGPLSLNENGRVPRPPRRKHKYQAMSSHCGVFHVRAQRKCLSQLKACISRLEERHSHEHFKAPLAPSHQGLPTLAFPMCTPVCCVLASLWGFVPAIFCGFF